MVDGLIGIGGVTQTEPLPHLERQHLRQTVPADMEGRSDGFDQNFVGDAGGETVQGQNTPGQNAGRFHRLKNRVGHLDAAGVALQFAIKNIALTVQQMVGNVPLIKERDGQPGRLVGQGDFGQIETLADVGCAGVGDDNGLEAGGLIHFQSAMARSRVRSS